MEVMLGTAIIMIVYNDDRQLSAWGRVASVTWFRESLCRTMMQTDIEQYCVVTHHYLREIADRKCGTCSDRRIRIYCIGCYDRKESGEIWQKEKPNV